MPTSAFQISGLPSLQPNRFTNNKICSFNFLTKQHSSNGQTALKDPTKKSVIAYGENPSLIEQYEWWNATSL